MEAYTTRISFVASALLFLVFQCQSTVAHAVLPPYARICRRMNIADADRFAQTLLNHGINRGRQDARKGINVVDLMTADLPTALLNMPGPAALNPQGAKITKMVASAPRDLQKIYVSIFLSGYRLGFKEAARPTAVSPSHNRMKLLSTAFLLYLQDNDGKLPPMESAACLKDALYAYVGSKEPFTDEHSHEPYQPNRWLSGKKLVDLSNRHSLIAIYQPQPTADGRRQVIFVDGRVRTICGKEWSRLRASSHILSRV